MTPERRPVEGSEPGTEELHNSMLRVASNLNSAITRGEAHKEFKKLKSQYPELPRSPELMCRMLDLMETYRIQLSVRRYIHGVFERASLRFGQGLALLRERDFPLGGALLLKLKDSERHFRQRVADREGRGIAGGLGIGGRSSRRRDALFEEHFRRVHVGTMVLDLFLESRE